MKPVSFLSFMAGALIGAAAAAVYLASDKGEAAREKIKDTMDESAAAAKKGYKEAKRKVKRYADDLEDKIKDEKENVRRKAKAAKEAI
ncbi:MAG: YtxH domain-containing protein [Bacteroidales bacterium]|jgi:gas vesicle protein|nr:YtxH domain-containing protein [Bacteroidales bacterium]MDD4670512.1 YtxH domain-containing protein [Bacteroidales bacterium]